MCKVKGDGQNNHHLMRKKKLDELRSKAADSKSATSAPKGGAK